MKTNIAIDGPSGAGKSTVSNLLAEKLGYAHLDTGSMYRAVAYHSLKNGLKMDEEAKVVELINKMKLSVLPDGRIFVDDEEVTGKIRTDEISMAASDVSKLLGVRKALVKMQQDIASTGGYILDGRDIGTVVLPDAKVKVFMSASPEERAQRRFLENVAKGMEADYKTILEDTKARDYQDSHRENSPLKKADDAIEIDTTNMSLDEVVDVILELVKKATE